MRWVLAAGCDKHLNRRVLPIEISAPKYLMELFISAPSELFCSRYEDQSGADLIALLFI
jgi:hypothetical protein